MSSLIKVFQVLLPSNVGGNDRNKPNLYETTLAKPLDLPGEWDVALIDIAYPHNWTNLDNSYKYLILKPKSDANAPHEAKFEPSAEREDKDLNDGIVTQTEFENWVVARGPLIRRGNYDITTIVNHIEIQFQMAFKNKNINLKFNLDEYRVELNPNVKFAIACYAEHSVLQVLGFGSESTLRKIPGKRG